MFETFFIAGFEGTATQNRHRDWIDQVAATQHDVHADGDYRRLREAGLCAAREAIRWPLVDKRGRYDFSSVEPFLAAAQRHRIAVIWDLFHYGYPADLDPFSSEFVQRFAAYCHAASQFVCARENGPHFFTPVNEPSFFAWAGGEVGRFAPHCHDRGPELKVALIRAAIAGIDAIRAACPDARIVNVDPICHVVAPMDRAHDPLLDPHDFNERAVFESWDMLCGRLHPELGGSPAHLDIVGVNYYWSNQWEIGREEQPLPPNDPRHVRLSELLRRTWRRYGAEMLITETAHTGDRRAEWMRCVVEECAELLGENIPLRGICLYPILGMPEWHDRHVWTRMGLWDLEPRGDTLERVLHEPMLNVLRSVPARRLEELHALSMERPALELEKRAAVQPVM